VSVSSACTAQRQDESERRVGASGHLRGARRARRDISAKSVIESGNISAPRALKNRRGKNISIRLSIKAKK